MRRMHGRAADAALALVSLLASAAALELAGRHIEARRTRRAEVASYIADWADWDGDFYTVRTVAGGAPVLADYNRDGLRDRDHAPVAPPGVRRVACLGDSTTMGWGIRPGESWPSVLQDRLQAGGQAVEVFNVALPGWSIRQERIAYRRIARRYGVRQVLLGLCLNDVPEMQNNLSRPPRLLSLLHRRSAAVRLAVGAEARQIAAVEELFADPPPARVSEAFDRTFAELAALRDEVRADGAGLAVVLFPFAFQLDERAPPPRAQRRIAAFGAANGIPVLDVLPALARAGGEAFIDYDHLSPLGARVVAESVLAAGLVFGEGVGEPPRPPLPPRGPSYRSVVEATRAPDPRARAAAARALGTMDPATDRAPLVALLADSDADTRASAAWALGALGPGAAVDAAPLAALLRDPDPRARAGAAYALGRLAPGEGPAAVALASALDDDDETVRWRAADALIAVRARDPAVVATLRAVVERDGPGIADAERVLASLGRAAAPAAPSLAAALADGRPVVRVNALRALGGIGPAAAGAVPAIAPLLADADVRTEAIDALGGIGPPASPLAPTLARALDDPSPHVRWRSALALGRMGPSAAAAVPAVVRASEAGDAEVRIAAVQALGKMQAADAVPSLVRLLAAGEDPRLRLEAVHALGRIGTAARPAVPGLVLLLDAPDAGTRAAAVRALGRIGGLSAEDRRRLARHLDDGDARVREQARRAVALVDATH